MSYKQVIIVKQFHNSIINITPVNYYLMAAMNKRLLIFESHGDSNRCTPCREKPNPHDTYASHASPRTPDVRFLWVVHVCGNLSQAINSVGRTLLLSRKRAPDTTPARLSDPHVRHPVSLPTHPLKQ
jgi:hypothetical protein